MILISGKKYMIGKKSLSWLCYDCIQISNCTYIDSDFSKKKISKKLDYHYKKDEGPLIILNKRKIKYANLKFIELVGADSIKEFYEGYWYIFKSLKNDPENFRKFLDIAGNLCDEDRSCLPLKIKRIDGKIIRLNICSSKLPKIGYGKYEVVGRVCNYEYLK